MKLKKISSLLFLITLLVSNLSFPVNTYAEDCKVISAKFTQKPQGANWYNSERTAHLLLAINNVDACKDKKVKVRVIAKSSETGDESIDVTKTPIEAVFDQGTPTMTLPFKVKEEKCFDLDSWNITNDYDGAEDISTILKKTKMEDQFYSNVYSQLKSGQIGNDLSTLYYFPQGLGNMADYVLQGAVPNTWLKEKMFPDSDRQALVDSKQSVQNILDRIQAAELPVDKSFLGSLVGKWDGAGALAAVNEIKEGKFRDAIAKTIFFRAGIYDCQYQIQVDNPATEKEDFEDVSGGDFAFMCDIGWTAAGDDCNDGLWEAKSGFSPGIRPTVVTESLCLNKDGTGYDENCYEPLAPIPGFGRKLNFSDSSSEDGTQPFTLGTYVGTVVKIAIGAASVAAVIFLTYAGIMYMVAGKSGGGALLDKARKRLISIAWGVAVILGSWIILNTINPELLKINPKFEKVTLEAPVMNRNAIPGFNEEINKINFDNTPIDMSQISDPILVTYMYHQQGEGGAPAIMWAAKKGYSSVPQNNPFTTSSKINSNMRNNYPDHCKTTFGPSSPRNFITCWVKIIAAKPADFSKIAPTNLAEIQKVSTETGLDLNLMKIMCLIESGCVDPTIDNHQGFVGLFQLSRDIYSKFGPGGGDRTNAYGNALAAAKYAKYNLGRYQKHKSTIGN